MNVVPALVVGAGPVGLTVAAELRRQGVQPRIVDRLEAPPQYAKAVGIQPRTLEIWEDMGVLPGILDAAIEFHGQIVYVNGAEVARMELTLPPDVPFRFFGLPQYETERILTEHLTLLGGRVERGVELRSLAQDDTGVSVTLAGQAGEETLRAQYVVGCDGAHSAVRRALELGFEGDAFAEEYMLGDVEVDWSLPPRYGIRAIHQSDGSTDDILVCIPLPGHGRYRMSMLVPPDLSGSKTEHGFASDRPAPTLAHIQAVLDRLGPEPTTARNLRWSSVFRISHRLVERYSLGRVFGYPDSPIVRASTQDGPGPKPGSRAPDTSGLARDGVGFSGRLFELLRGPDHVLLLYADEADGLGQLENLATAARDGAHGRLRAYAIVAGDVDAGRLALPSARDAEGTFRSARARRRVDAECAQPTQKRAS